MHALPRRKSAPSAHLNEFRVSSQLINCSTCKWLPRSTRRIGIASFIKIPPIKSRLVSLVVGAGNVQIHSCLCVMQVDWNYFHNMWSTTHYMLLRIIITLTCWCHFYDDYVSLKYSRDWYGIALSFRDDCHLMPGLIARVINFTWICIKLSPVSGATVKPWMVIAVYAVGQCQFSHARTHRIVIGSLIERTIIKQTISHHYCC